jgi:hypothetical protein
MGGILYDLQKPREDMTWKTRTDAEASISDRGRIDDKKNPSNNWSTPFYLSRHHVVLLQHHPPLTAPAAVLADSGPVLAPVAADVVELAEAPCFGDFFGGLAVACVVKKGVSR